jgi:hypothetical protein
MRITPSPSRLPEPIRTPGPASAAHRTSSGGASPAVPRTPFQSLFGEPAAPAPKPAAPSSSPAPPTSAPQTMAPAVAAPTGIAALVQAMMNGTFKSTSLTSSQLVEQTPLGSFPLSAQQYASDQTAIQLANLLGGAVVQKPATPLPNGWQAPNADFIELPGGQVVNAGDLASYAKCAYLGAQQLTADITQEINQGAAISSFNDGVQSVMNGLSNVLPPAPTFRIGDTGPAIAGMAYPTGTLAADGSVINPSQAPLYKTNGG